MGDKIFFAPLAALCLALLFSCAKSKGQQEYAALEVKTFAAKKEAQSVALDAFGSVTYKKKNEVTSLVEGTIYELRAQEGSKVFKGDVLLRMRNVQYEIQRTERKNELNSAKAKVRAAKNNLTERERSIRARLTDLENSRATLAQKKDELELSLKKLESGKKLFGAGGLSKSAYEKMQVDAKAASTEIDILEKEIAAAEMGFRDKDLEAAGIVPASGEEKIAQLVGLNARGAVIEIELAEVAVQNAEQNLMAVESLMENLTVRAPASGIVGALKCENGESVTQNQALATIIDMDEPCAQVNVQEKDMDKIALGSPALVEIESLGQRQESEVSFISPLADCETGNFYVKIPLSNKDQSLRLGMFARCEIQTKRAGEFYSIPQSAVVRRDGNNVSFYCVQNNFVYKKECPVEMEKDGKIFVAAGLCDGEKIIERPAAEIKEGSHVKEI